MAPSKQAKTKTSSAPKTPAKAVKATKAPKAEPVEAAPVPPTPAPAVTNEVVEASSEESLGEQFSQFMAKLQQVAGGALEQRLEELSKQSSALREHLQAERESLWSKVCIQEANYLKICNLKLIQLSDLVCWEILHHWLKMNNLNPNFERIQGLARQIKKSPSSPWCWEIGKGWQVRSKSGQLTLEHISTLQPK